MTYLKLLEIIEAMSEEQQSMAVVVSGGGEYSEPEAVAEISFCANEGFYPVGQVVILT